MVSDLVRHALVAAIRGAVLISLGAFFTQPAYAQCAQDFPTAASLAAARMAIDGGAADVALSPAGCWRYRRWFWPGGPPEVGAPQQQRDETSFDGRMVEAWDYFTARAQIPPNPPWVTLYSFGRRDNDRDGFIEWQATITRDITPPASGAFAPLPPQIVIDEYDPVSRSVARRETVVVSSDTAHVTVEEGAGSLQVVREYDVPALEQTAIRASPLATVRAPPTDELSLISVPCPTGFKAQFENVLFQAADNGGRCLAGLGLQREAMEIAVASFREFKTECVRGADYAAEVYFLDTFDHARPVRLIINLDHWDTPGNREEMIFHELWHAYTQRRHDPALEQLKRTNPRRYYELDRVYACQVMCYFPQNATKCECARCLRKTQCDVPCDSKQACVSNQIGAMCPCPKKAYRWFEERSRCEVDCPSGLACAFARCTPEINACKS